MTDVLRRSAGVVFQHQQLVSLTGETVHFERLPETHPDTDRALGVRFVRPHEISGENLARVGRVRREIGRLIRQLNAEFVSTLDFYPPRVHRASQRLAVGVEAGMIVDAEVGRLEFGCDFVLHRLSAVARAVFSLRGGHKKPERISAGPQAGLVLEQRRHVVVHALFQRGGQAGVETGSRPGGVRFRCLLLRKLNGQRLIGPARFDHPYRTGGQRRRRVRRRVSAFCGLVAVGKLKLHGLHVRLGHHRLPLPPRHRQIVLAVVGSRPQNQRVVPDHFRLRRLHHRLPGRSVGAHIERAVAQRYINGPALL